MYAQAELDNSSSFLISAAVGADDKSGFRERSDVVGKNVYFEVLSDNENLHKNHNRSLSFMEQLIRCCLTTSFLLGYQKKFRTEFSKSFWVVLKFTLSYETRQLADESSFECLLEMEEEKALSSHYHASLLTNFYSKLYRILWKIFYLDNEADICNHCNLFVIAELYGIEKSNNRCSKNLRQQKLDYNYKCLLKKRHHEMCCGQSFRIISVKSGCCKQHHILLQQVAHNQIISCDKKVSSYRQQSLQDIEIQLSSHKSCNKIRNGASSLETTSNHKLKRSKEKSEKIPRFHQLLHSFFRFNDGAKSQLNAVLFLVILLVQLMSVEPSVHNVKYSTNTAKTKYGLLRGIILQSDPLVEGYFGVPYATPPVGSLRYMPPVTPSTWKNSRLADRFAPVCPQNVPVSDTGMEALLEMPRGRLAQLRRMKAMLSNHSEDCLYLNMYVPRDDDLRGSINKPMATLVYIHGESFEWNSGNLYDGTVLAAHSKIIVVTINFRLGILGFLKTGTKGSAQGNFGLMDLVAGLHWLRENLPAFNGNPNMVTLMGHGHGAALANILVVSPVASDLIHRAVLISGSALSPWAIQKDPLSVKKKVAADTGCHGDLLEDDLAPCLRKKSIAELLTIKLEHPRFLPGFAPFVDGTVIVNQAIPSPSSFSVPSGSAVAGSTNIEMADFPTRELLFGVTSIESYLDFSAQDLEFGFNETRRDRILRTYVRNIYQFHLNEIFSALKNEYTDWERPPRNQLGSRDAALELLSDGHTVAPLIRLAYLHNLRGGKSFFMHYKHRTEDRDFPQRYGTVRGEDVPFSLGLPLSPLFPYNYTQQDFQTSRVFIHYLTNFIRTGNPNGDVTPSSKHSIDLETFRPQSHYSNRHHEELLPEPLLLSSSTSVKKGAIQLKKRHRRSSNINSSTFKRRTSGKRLLIKRNFPNNFLSNPFDSDNDTKLDSVEGEDNLFEHEVDRRVKSKIFSNERDLSDVEDIDSNAEKTTKLSVPYWNAYDTVNQFYLEINAQPQMKNHYRGHKLSMWLSLIPQIHSPGESPDLPVLHHHFNEENPQFYDGKVRQQSSVRPTPMRVSALLTTTTPKYKTETASSSGMQSLTTDCPPNTTIIPTVAATRPQHNQDNSINSSSFLRRLTSNHYQSYATALAVTIAVGCFLLLMNVFIFAAIYYQREKRATYTRKKEELTEAENLNSSSSPSIERYQQKGSRKSSLQSVSGAGFGEYSCYDEKLRFKKERVAGDSCTVDVSMQKYKYSPPCESRSISPQNSNNNSSLDHQSTQDELRMLPPSYASQMNGTNIPLTYRSISVPKTAHSNQATQVDSPPRVHDASTGDNDPGFSSDDIPNPPPPPRSSFQSSILRQSSAPITPGMTKKRVHIQEISV